MENSMASLLASVFSGAYNFNRQVSSPQVTMKGYGRFSILEHNLHHYHEEGTYNWQGNEVAFYQNNLFAIQANELCILKSDKSLLHQFNLPPFTGFPVGLSHLHLCNNDQYRVDICIHSVDEFSMYYQVVGPHKNYTITTDFFRAL